MSFIADIMITIAAAIYIADNWQQVKNVFTMRPPGS